jgi:hypothetical protein
MMIGGWEKYEIPIADCPPLKCRMAKVRKQPALTPLFIGDREFYVWGDPPNLTILAAAIAPPEKHKHPPN